MSEFNAVIWPIISGRWAFRDLVVLALRFITIAVQHMDPKADRSLTRIVTLKYGTLSLCRIFAAKAAARIVTQSWENFRRRILIPVLGLNAWPLCSKALKISMKLIRRCRSLIVHLRFLAQSMAPIRNLMLHFVLLQITLVLR